MCNRYVGIAFEYKVELGVQDLSPPLKDVSSSSRSRGIGIFVTVSSHSNNDSTDALACGNSKQYNTGA